MRNVLLVLPQSPLLKYNIWFKFNRTFRQQFPNFTNILSLLLTLKISPNPLLTSIQSIPILNQQFPHSRFVSAFSSIAVNCRLDMYGSRQRRRQDCRHAIFQVENNDVRLKGSLFPSRLLTF